MLNESDIGPDSQWSTVRSQLSSLAAFSAVGSPEDRQQLFQEYVTDLQVLSAQSCLRMILRCYKVPMDTAQQMCLLVLDARSCVWGVQFRVDSWQASVAEGETATSSKK